MNDTICWSLVTCVTFLIEYWNNEMRSLNISHKSLLCIKHYIILFGFIIETINLIHIFQIWASNQAFHINMNPFQYKLTYQRTIIINTVLVFEINMLWFIYCCMCYSIDNNLKFASGKIQFSHRQLISNSFAHDTCDKIKIMLHVYAPWQINAYKWCHEIYVVWRATLSIGAFLSLN